MHGKRESQGHQQGEARQTSDASAERCRRGADLDLIRSLLESENYEVERTAQWYDFLAVNENLCVRIPGIRDL